MNCKCVTFKLFKHFVGFVVFYNFEHNNMRGIKIVIAMNQLGSVIAMHQLGSVIAKPRSTMVDELVLVVAGMITSKSISKELISQALTI